MTLAVLVFALREFLSPGGGLIYASSLPTGNEDLHGNLTLRPLRHRHRRLKASASPSPSTSPRPAPTSRSSRADARRSMRPWADQGARTNAHVIGVQADVGNADGVQARLRRREAAFGKVDILVNNAGTSRAARSSEVTDELLAARSRPQAVRRHPPLPPGLPADEGAPLGPHHQRAQHRRQGAARRPARRPRCRAPPAWRSPRCWRARARRTTCWSTRCWSD